MDKLEAARVGTPWTSWRPHGYEHHAQVGGRTEWPDVTFSHVARVKDVPAVCRMPSLSVLTCCAGDEFIFFSSLEEYSSFICLFSRFSRLWTIVCENVYGSWHPGHDLVLSSTLSVEL
ncbi:hypothetical protein RRG08_043759 [Elysia crispata]|uniref:Uncharacterized protein n=1 Tax=Elysia crispata TaxID=231223 RepID=A0AAE1DJ15_9GAST|nr:hypothetical protein RRG08_043759 [Elysia crispata]